MTSRRVAAFGRWQQLQSRFQLLEACTRAQWNPTPQLDIGLQLMYTHHNTAYKRAALVIANPSRPAIALIDDQNVWSAMFRWQRNFYP